MACTAQMNAPALPCARQQVGSPPKGVLNHCTLSRAHNLLNSMPSSELGRNALALTKLLGLGIALKGDGESRRTRCVRTLTAESETYMYTCYYQI